jgi:DNA topoisomerase-1
MLNKGDCPAKQGVDATQHFTQPPPRYSEASLVKRLEELGIGRPSTYAATLQVLKDRAYVRTEKNRFFAEESGRMLTAFLERFFDRYVAYEFTAGMEDELDDVSVAAPRGSRCLPNSGATSSPRPTRSWRRSRARLPPNSTCSWGTTCSPARRWPRPARMPQVRRGRLSLRGGRYGAFIACSNYPECKFTRKFAQPGGAEGEGGDDTPLGKDPATDLEVTRRTGRFGPYIQLGEGKEAKRASIPKDIPELDLEWALKLLHLPRELGPHPETGNMITASIGRYGPYLAHDGKYARLKSTAEVFETGMNAAVVLLAEAASGAGRRGARTPPNRSRPLVRTRHRAAKSSSWPGAMAPM